MFARADLAQIRQRTRLINAAPVCLIRELAAKCSGPATVCVETVFLHHAVHNLTSRDQDDTRQSTSY